MHCVIAVWGEQYVDSFLNIALPSLLAPGNIPACTELADVSFRIYTRVEDVPSIEAHSRYRDLCSYLSPQIVPLITAELLSSCNRYGAMAACHHEEIALTRSDRGIINVLSPDCLVSDGSLARGLRRILEGDKAVLVAGPRGVLDDIAPILKQQIVQNASAPLALSSRTLVGLGMRHLHPISQILFWDAPALSRFPSALYWPAGQESMLMKYFHLHPLFVDLADAPPEVTRCGSVDGALISTARIRPEQIYYITHSDEVALLELSSRKHDPMGSIPEPTQSRFCRMVSFIHDATDATHRRQFLDHDIRFQGNEDVDWGAVEQRVRRDLWHLRLVLPCFQAAAGLRTCASHVIASVRNRFSIRRLFRV